MIQRKVKRNQGKERMKGKLMDMPRKERIKGKGGLEKRRTKEKEKP